MPCFARDGRGPGRIMRKYRNIKVHYDGYLFDSKEECKRYKVLVLLQKVGEIEKLVVHPRFVLQPAFYASTQEKKIRAVTATWDFGYLEPDGRKVVEDVKSPITRKEVAYNIRKRLFIKMFPDIDFREIV